MERTKQFFHGTNREFAPGDRIVPPSAGGHKASMPEVSNPDHVYVSTDPKEAQSFADYAASRHGGTARVYGVDTKGRHWTDPNDHLRPEAFRTMHVAPWVEVTHLDPHWSRQ